MEASASQNYLILGRFTQFISSWLILFELNNKGYCRHRHEEKVQDECREICFSKFKSRGDDPITIDDEDDNVIHPNKMIIKLKDGYINVNQQSIHDMVGVPIGGWDINELESCASDNALLVQWRRQFGNKAIRAANIITMKMGTCNTSILPKIIQLLYLDAMNCVKVLVSWQRPTIKSWTMELMRRRELAEIENGGFGRGDINPTLHRVINIDGCSVSDESNSLRSSLNDIEGYISTITAKSKMIIDQKVSVELKLKEGFLKYLCNEDIRNLKHEYIDIFVMSDLLSCDDYGQLISTTSLLHHPDPFSRSSRPILNRFLDLQHPFVI
ncbi:hypothetical protein L6452_01572 [Arctium lappa]|uniref:Uncharacterized protein n=1 Tax=Arctium lappa TaxID=4217 RepID=A0ACB9FGH5_ARCLA|nr:hypothetical protein L6452_01572 [Arctium lappa]